MHSLLKNRQTRQLVLFNDTNLQGVWVFCTTGHDSSTYMLNVHNLMLENVWFEASKVIL